MKRSRQKEREREDDEQNIHSRLRARGSLSTMVAHRAADNKAGRLILHLGRVSS